jgi:hypothetical protein
MLNDAVRNWFQFRNRAPLPAYRPLSVEVQPNHYVVRDANRQHLAYVYYENEPGRRIAANTAKLPELFLQALMVLESE